LNVDLTPELEKLIRSKVQSGRYDSISEVIREALQLLDQRDRIFATRKEECREKIEEGWVAARRGDLVDGDRVFDRVDAELVAAEIAKNDRSGRG
jgi:antitoxin ParD1/3/4